MKRKRTAREIPGNRNTLSSPVRAGRGPSRRSLWLVCAYLVLIQPLLYFVIPVVRYDEFRLPARESAVMLSTSVDAWWRTLVVAFGIACGVKLWRHAPNALASLRFYLLAYLASACLLIAFPCFLPFQSFLRTHILIEQSQLFFEALVVFLIGYGYFACSRQWKAAFTMPAQNIGNGFSMSRPFAMAVAGSSVVVGVSCSIAAFHVAPRDIFEAAWEGNAAAVRRFIAAGADVNSTGFDAATPLHLASTREIAELLADTSSEIEDSYLLKPDDLKDASNLIHKLHFRTDPVSALLWTRFSPAGRDALTNEGFPQWELPTIVLSELNSVLRQRLAYDANAFQGVPLSPSTLALKNTELTGMKTLSLSRHLLEDAYPRELAKYQIDARNLLKETPLHIAAFNGRADVARFLSQRGAYLNAPNTYKWTPLDYAIFARGKGRKGDIDGVISLLVHQGAQANVLQHRMQLEALARGPGAGF